MTLLTRATGLLVLTLGTGACTQDVLTTASQNAEDITRLFWTMTTVGGLVWAGVTYLVFVAADRLGVRRSGRTDAWLILGGGLALPIVILTALLAITLPMLSRSATAADRLPADDGWRIDLRGEQWWWRVRYIHSSGQHFELANEVRLPVGQRVPVALSSNNVIHSFWVPALGGKMDMIPGRTTHVSLAPTRTGTFRGVCAEYCGTAHAHMAFSVTVLDQAEFEAWAAGQARPARDGNTPTSTLGRARFEALGCGACHTVRGTAAGGVIGPDLTHVGARSTLAAGTVANTHESLRLWIADPQRHKPGNHMPSFASIGQSDLDAITTYLRELR